MVMPPPARWSTTTCCPQASVYLLAEHAHHHVGPAAGRGRDDDADGPVGIGLLRAVRGDGEREQRGSSVRARPSFMVSPTFNAVRMKRFRFRESDSEKAIQRKRSHQ